MSNLDTGLRFRHYRYRYKDLEFPEMEKPQIVGYFSVTTNGDYEPGARNLRYYKPPKKFPFDLNEGYENTIENPETETSNSKILLNMLQFIYNARGENYKNVPPKSFVDAEFIAFRNLLRLIMDTPYEFKKAWCIHVTKFKGNYYLNKSETQRMQNDRVKSDKQKNIRSCYKFIQHCTSEYPSQDPDTSLPVDQSAKFCCVYKTNLQGLKLLYGAVTDGIISETPINEDISTFNNLRFVKLKVSQHELNKDQQNIFKRFKSRLWWCQSFLVNIKDIYFGGQNANGIVEKINHVDVSSLPEQGKDYWTPTVCTNFLVQFLTCVKSLMQDVNCPYTVFEFYFDPQMSKITYRRLNGKTVHSCLPEWFINFLN